MINETINTHEIIALFQEFMHLDSQIHVIRLLGNAKMGKTHLLTKVFPSLVRKPGLVRYAVLDLRNPMHAVPDILGAACNGLSACSQLGDDTFNHYQTAYQTWLDRSRVGISHIYALFSSLHVSAKESPDDIYNRDRHLAMQFVMDVKKLDDKPFLLFFDSVNNANEHIQTWLMDTLLVHLSSLAHVRVVVAGRSLPEAHGSYAQYCRDYQLQPITVVEEYIHFCRNLNANLVEQSIRDLAYAFDYTPGLFAETVGKKFVQRKMVNG